MENFEPTYSGCNGVVDLRAIIRFCTEHIMTGVSLSLRKPDFKEFCTISIK